MNLPNYFLADLPPTAAITPALLTEACQTLKRNRNSYLAGRTTEALINVLSVVAANWLRPDDPIRRIALEHGPKETGFTAPTLARGLEAFFAELTEDNLRALLAQDLGDAQRLDQFVAEQTGQKSNRRAIARGPELLVHIAAGNLPNPTFASIVLGLLVRSAQFIKCATGSAFLPRLFAHSIYAEDPKLGACIELAEWPGGKIELEQTLFNHADCVTVTGDDNTIAAVRQLVPPNVRFIGYGHRVSFSFVTAQVLARATAARIAALAAADVTAWDQLGCLSPHVIYVETGGEIGPDTFAELLAAELGRIEKIEPRALPPTEAVAQIASRRAFYEVRAANMPDTRIWTSTNSTAWTVVYEADPLFQLSCLHRFIYVKPVRDLAEALANAESVRGKVSTVGVAASAKRTQQIATVLAAWGVSRVCPIGRMQQPPLAWRHDGRPALAELVTWTDWESD